MASVGSSGTEGGQLKYPYGIAIEQCCGGGHFWSSGYYMNTVGQHGTKEGDRRKLSLSMKV